MNKYTYFLLMAFIVSLPVDAVEPLNRTITIVNDDVILISQLNNREKLVLKQLQESNTQAPPENVLRRQILDRLVLENLQLQMAERNGIRIDDDMLNSNLRAMASENKMTLSEFRDKLESENYDYATFREQLRDEITISRIRQQMVENRTQVTDQEVDNLLASASSYDDADKEYRLSHILISVPEAASPDDVRKAKQRADHILLILKQGADFAETAVAESEGQQALNGGDLGWRKTGKLPTLFTNVVDQLREGQISDIIRSPSGFHIIKITGIRGDEPHIVNQTHARHILLKTDTMTSDDARNKLNQMLERIQHGDDFAALARAHSEDTGSASKGGDLGWVNPGEMVPEFEKAMNKLQNGNVSKPVQSRFGWHLIEVIDRRTRDNSEEYQRARARESIRRRKVDEEMEIWLRRLRDESYVEDQLNEPFS